MQYIDNQLYLKTEDFIKAGVLEDAVKRGLEDNRNNGSQSWQHFKSPTDGRQKLIAYESLPKITKSRVDACYTNVYEMAYKSLFKTAVENQQSIDDAIYFSGLRIKKNGSGYTDEELKDICMSCGVLRVLSEADADKVWRGGMRVSVGKTLRGRTEYFEWAAKQVSAMNLYGFRLKNGRQLERRLQTWKADGLASMVSRKNGNSNADKCRDMPLVRDMMMEMHVTKTMNLDAISRRILEEFGVKYEQQSIGKFLNLPQNQELIAAPREGRGEAAKTKYTRVTRAKLTGSNIVWEIDGTPPALFANVDGQMRKAPFYYVVVLDVYSGAIIGEAYGKTETAELVKRAIGNAIANTGYLPNTFRYDNGSGNKSAIVQDVIKDLESYGFACAPYNPQGKSVIEKTIDLLETGFMRGLVNFAGGNVKRRGTEKSINTDKVKEAMKRGEVPNTEGVLEQMKTAIRLYNSTAKKGVTPSEKYKGALTHGMSRKATIEVVTRAFWTERERTVRYSNSGLELNINGERRHYWVGLPEAPDGAFMTMQAGRNFKVRVGEGIDEMVALYTTDGRFVAMAVEQHKFGYLPELMTKDMMSALRAIWKMNKDKMDRAFLEKEGRNERLTAAGIDTVYSYELQHKDAFNRMEAEMAEEYLNEGRAVLGIKEPTAVTEIIEDDNEDDDNGFMAMIAKNIRAKNG